MKRIAMMSAIAAMTISTSSAAAAQEFGSSAPTISRNAAFIGAQARLSLGTGKRVVPVARLAAGMTNLSFSHHGELVNRHGGSAFELGFSRGGRADFYVGGQRYTDLKAKFGVAPLGVALLAVGGLAAVGATLAAGGGAAAEQKNEPRNEQKQWDATCTAMGICPPLPRPRG